MLWRVEGTGLHLLGALHTATRPLELGETAMQCLSRASVLAFETHEETRPEIRFGGLPRGRALRESVSGALHEEASRTWHQLRLHGSVDEQPVWLVALRVIDALMAAWGFRAENGVERAIRARCRGKRVFSLEAADAALRVMASGPAHEQEEFLSQAVWHQEDGRRDLLTAETAWRASRVEEMLPIVERQQRRMPVMHAGLVQRRNEDWMRHLVRFTNAGRDVVAVVGTMHLIGPGSIPELFSGHGFRCVQVPPRSSETLPRR